MSMQFQGLTDFQRDLLQTAQRRLPKQIPKVMRKAGSKARTTVAKKARRLVKKKTGNYHKAWKRGKVFIDPEGKTVVRVYNSSPHAHLIEDGHRQVTKSGREVGFVPGKKVLEKGMQEFNSTGEFEKMIADWLDEQLRKGKL